jgi:hypothetical protein
MESIHSFVNIAHGRLAFNTMMHQLHSIIMKLENFEKTLQQPKRVKFFMKLLQRKLENLNQK